MGVWNPTWRGFIVPVGNAEPLADAPIAGADGVEGSNLALSAAEFSTALMLFASRLRISL